MNERTPECFVRSAPAFSCFESIARWNIQTLRPIVLLPHFLPAAHFLCLFRRNILVSIEPKAEPIHVSHIDLVFVLRLISYMTFAGIDPQLHGFAKFTERDNSRQIADVFGIRSVLEDRNGDSIRS